MVTELAPCFIDEVNFLEIQTQLCKEKKQKHD